jgi:hypothetical protein
MGGYGATVGVLFSRLNEADKDRPWQTQLEDAVLTGAFGAYAMIISPPILLAIKVEDGVVKGKFRWN